MSQRSLYDEIVLFNIKTAVGLTIATLTGIVWLTILAIKWLCIGLYYLIKLIVNRG